VELKRTRIFDAATIGIGAIIGAGIFVALFLGHVVREQGDIS